MKKAIALMIVISFITIIMGLLVSIYTIYDKFSNSTFSNTISEDSVLIEDVTTILNRLTKQVTDDDAVKIVCRNYKNIILNENIKVDINIKPLFDRLNINKFNEKNKGMDLFFDNVFEIYGIEDGDYFKSILLDTLDYDEKERGFDTEIKLYNPYFQDGAIYNYKQFKMILDWYFKHTKDKKIFLVPWKKLFFFKNIHIYSFLDCNLLNKEIVKILGIETDNISCDNIKSNINEIFIKKLAIMPFQKKSNFLIRVNIKYILKGSKSEISFIYNIKTKKVLDSEKYPIY